MFMTEFAELLEQAIMAVLSGREEITPLVAEDGRVFILTNTPEKGPGYSCDDFFHLAIKSGGRIATLDFAYKGVVYKIDGELQVIREADRQTFEAKMQEWAETIRRLSTKKPAEEKPVDLSGF